MTIKNLNNSISSVSRLINLSILNTSISISRVKNLRTEWSELSLEYNISINTKSSNNSNSSTLTYKFSSILFISNSYRGIV